MDLDRVLLALYTVSLALLLASGIVHAQWEADDDISEQFQPMERRDWGISSYEPDYDWSKLETFRDNDNTLVNLFKRGGAFVTDSYRRLPRIKQIIPFYSYGDAFGGLRSRLYGSRRKTPYPYNPWSRKSYFTGRRVQTPIYPGY